MSQVVSLAALDLKPCVWGSLIDRLEVDIRNRDDRRPTQDRRGSPCKLVRVKVQLPRVRVLPVREIKVARRKGRIEDTIGQILNGPSAIIDSAVDLRIVPRNLLEVKCLLDLFSGTIPDTHNPVLACSTENLLRGRPG